MRKEIRSDEYIQSLLDERGEVYLPPVNPMTGDNRYDIAAPLILRSGTHLVLDGCTLRLCDHVYSNIFISEGAWDDTPAAVTDISIEGRNGACLDGGQFNGLTERTSAEPNRPNILNNTFILFRNVKGFRVEGLHFTNPRYWNVTFYYCSEGRIADLVFDSANNAPNQDGIDLRLGCHHIEIENISGSTGDDTVALTGLLHPIEARFHLNDICPDIHHVKIRNIHTEVTGGHGIIRLLCHDGVKLHHVDVEDIYDCLMDTKHTINQAAVRIGDRHYFSVRAALSGELHDVRVRNVKTNATVPVKVYGDVPGLVCENIE